MLKFTTILMLVSVVSLVNSATITKNDHIQSSASDNITSKPELTSNSDQDDMMSEEKSMPDLMVIMNECNETFTIDIGYLESLNESGSFPDETYRTPKCYIRCFLEKSGVATLDGQFNPEVAAAIFAGERNGKVMEDLQTMAETCATGRTENCRCERSYRFLKCLMESEIKKYEERR